MRKPYSIGREPGCSFVIDHPSVSRVHAHFRPVEEGLEIHDPGSQNGSFVVRQGKPERIETTRVGLDALLRFGEIDVPATDLVAKLGARAPTEQVGKRTQVGRPCPRCAQPVAPGQSMCGFCDCALDGPAAEQRWVLGSDPNADLSHPHPSLDPRHLAIRVGVGRLFLTDLGSAKGTRFGPNRARLQPGTETAVELTDALTIGELELTAGALRDQLRGLTRQPNVSRVSIPEDARDFVVGRDPSCDVVLPDPQVSWRHARFRRQGAAWRVQDLGSSNGTWMAGRTIADERVEGSAIVGIGSWELHLEPSSVRAETLQGRIRLDVVHASKVVDRGRKTILRDVSFSILPGELVSIMGPSGAGKTTLLLCLSANDVASAGEVRINGLDLARQFARYQGQIGYVPQDDIVHDNLTVHDALYYYARLRLPPDTRRAEIEQRIDQVLEELHLTPQKGLRIGSPREKILSGGQRRRVNLGMELVTDPLVLFADEPTSGLSSEDSKEVIGALRREADKGRPVVVTIHQPSGRLYRQFDLSMLLGVGGRLAFFGPPEPDAYGFFGADEGDPESLMEAVESRPPEEWEQRYQSAEPHRRYVAARQQWTAAPAEAPPRQRLQPRGWHAVRILCARLLKIKASGVKSWLRYLLPPLVVLGLLAAVYNGVSDADQTIGKRADPLFFLVMGTVFFGLFNAATEIVAERPIYHRERLAGMTIGSYLVSKLLVVGLVTAMQAVLLGLPAAFLLKLSAPPWALVVSLAVAGMAAVSLGLLLSALVPRAEIAMNLVPILLIAQLLLSGFLSPVRTGAKRIIAGPMISYWGADMIFTAENMGLKQRRQARCAASKKVDDKRAKLRKKYRWSKRLRKKFAPLSTAGRADLCRKRWDAYLGRKHKEGRGYYLKSLAVGGGALALLAMLFFLLTAWILRLQDPAILKRAR